MRAIGEEALGALTAAAVLPFTLTLGIGTGEQREFECRALLRVLPGRRQVIEAMLGDQRVVLKLFTGSGRARYLRRELRGLGWLEGAGVPVADALEQITGRAVCGVVLRHLAGESALASRDAGVLEEIARLVGCMHAAGTWQADLHLDNFLVSGDRVFVLDGDGVRHRVAPLSGSEAMDNLAMLAAQRPPAEDERLADMLAGYGQGRGTAPPVPEAFLPHLHEARRRRTRRYLAKTLRSCSEFVVGRGWRQGTYGVRERAEGLAVLGGEPDALFTRQPLLKAGNSATVVVTPDGLVVKRYNIKSLSHGLRRMLRPLPRYRRAWAFGQLLHLLEIPTTRPLALLERRFGFWRGVAYLVSERLDGPDLFAEVAEKGLSEERLEEVTRLFLLLRRAGLTHGDTKASNFLVHDGRLHLIDLDAMRLDARGAVEDVRRFLENWEAPVRTRFEASFREAGLLS